MKTGKDLLELANKHKGERYIFGIVVPKNVADWRNGFDCAEFFSYILFQVAGIAYGWANNKGNPETADAYTGFIARDVEALGVKISVEEAKRTPGACLLRLAGNGMIGHVVFSDGVGGTIEAHGTKTGVINSVVNGRRWDYGFKVPGIDYVTRPVTEPYKAPQGTVYRFKNPLMKDEVIEKLQILLRERKLYTMPVDGIYGKATFEAVRAFQVMFGLTPDGEAGNQTLTLLGLK